MIKVGAYSLVSDLTTVQCLATHNILIGFFYKNFRTKYLKKTNA